MDESLIEKQNGNFANTVLPAGVVNLGQNFNTKNETKILNKKAE